MPIPASSVYPDLPARRLPPELKELNLMDLSGLIIVAGGHAVKKSRWQHFVGSVSPVGHMLQVLSGCGRLK